jgi:hypothetical protein
MKKYNGWIIGLLVLVVGSATLFFGIKDIPKERYFAAHSQQTRGKIVAVNRAASSDSAKFTYVPVVNFVSRDGMPHQFTASAETTDPVGYTVGADISVRYLPEDPAQARLATQGAGLSVSITTILLGAFFTVIGLVIVAAMVWSVVRPQNSPHLQP